MLLGPNREHLAKDWALAREDVRRSDRYIKIASKQSEEDGSRENGDFRQSRYPTFDTRLPSISVSQHLDSGSVASERVLDVSVVNLIALWHKVCY